MSDSLEGNVSTGKPELDAMISSDMLSAMISVRLKKQCI
jgi:hypothetical protein